LLLACRLCWQWLTEQWERREMAAHSHRQASLVVGAPGVGTAVGTAASLPLSVVMLQNTHSLFPVSFLPDCLAESQKWDSPCLKAVRNRENMCKTVPEIPCLFVFKLLVDSEVSSWGVINGGRRNMLAGASCSHCFRLLSLCVRLLQGAWCMCNSRHTWN